VVSSVFPRYSLNGKPGWLGASPHGGVRRKPPGQDLDKMLEDVGSPDVPDVATLCVTSSLALVAMGGFDPSGGFRLGTLTVCRPLGNHGAILDTVAVSCDVEGALYE
jgi:hypothetical protein